MMSYAPGSSVGTTSTSVPDCGKQTPDHLAVCTVERTVTHSLPPTGAQQDHNNHRVHRGEEQNPMDRTTITKGIIRTIGPQGGENHQHDIDTTR